MKSAPRTTRSAPKDAPAKIEGLVEQLTRLVVSGQWEPGSLLQPERELALQLGVGRPRLREAIKQLQSQGLLTVKHGVGTVVNGVTTDPVRRVFDHTLHGQEDALLKLTEMRLIMETEIAALAAQRATPSDLEALEASLNAIDGALDDLEAYTELDMAFHACLSAATHNDLLYAVLEPLAQKLRESRRLTLSTSISTRQSQAEHHAIFEAVRNRNSKLARQRMEQHLQALRASLEASLDKEKTDN